MDNSGVMFVWDAGFPWFSVILAALDVLYCPSSIAMLVLGFYSGDTNTRIL